MVNLVANSSSVNASTATKPEIIADADRLSQLPEEVIFRMFGFLSAMDLAKCGEVSRRWNRVAGDNRLWNAFDLRKIFPSLKVFNEQDWADYIDLAAFGLDVNDAPPCETKEEFSSIYASINKIRTSPIEENRGVTLLTLPKGLTINKLVKLARSPKKGNGTMVFYAPFITDKIGDIPVEKTYRIVITNNVIKESRGEVTFHKKKELLNIIGCQMPKMIESTLHLIANFMKTGERFYDDNPWTFTVVSDEHPDFPEVHFAVGGFFPLGITIQSDSRGSPLTDDMLGVGGVVRI